MRSSKGRRWRGHLGQTHGTSLVELLVAVVIVGVILVAMVELLRHTQQSYIQGSAAADVQGDIRAALDQITHDLRRAGKNPRGCVFSTFVSGSATSLQLQRDLDNANTSPSTSCVATTASAEEQVTFSFDSGTGQLTRAVGNGSATVLARNVEAPSGVIFRYHYLPNAGVNCLNGTLSNTTTPTSTQLVCTRRVTVTLRGSISTAIGAIARTVETDVDLRSR